MFLRCACLYVCMYVCVRACMRVCVCVHTGLCTCGCVCAVSSVCLCIFWVTFFIFQIFYFFRVWLRLTPVSSCVSCVGLLVQDLTDTILSSYAYKSHYLLTESNRAELKLPMIPSPSSATKKNVGKGNCTVFLFYSFVPLLCVCDVPAPPRSHSLSPVVRICHSEALGCQTN